MAARNTKGLKIFLEKGGTTPGALTATAISNAKPAQVTTAATLTAANGDLVKVTGSDLTTLDNKFFTISGLVADTSFDLTGSDASGEAAPAAKGNITFYNETADLQVLCLSEVGINSETPDTISVATFCDPSASVPGATSGAGTLDFSGFMDITDPGYKLLIDAEADGLKRVVMIKPPGAQGVVVAEGVISSMSLSEIPIDGAIAFSAQMSLSSKYSHVF